MPARPSAARAGRGLAPFALTLLPALLATAPAAAQDQAPNPLLTFSFSSSLNASDNYDLSVDSPGSSTFLDNNLGLAYESETDVQYLRFGLSGVARLADLPEQDVEAKFDNQTVVLEYRRTGADSQIGVTGRYNRADLAFFDPLSLLDLDEPIDEEDLVSIPDGYRETTNLGISFETGLSSPLSFSISASSRSRNFIGTEGTRGDLYDTLINSVSSSVGALVTPSTRLTLSGTVSHYDAEDDENTRRLNRSVSLGASHEMARALTINGAIGYQLIDTDETDEFGQRGTTTDDGLTGSFGLSQELTNGTVEFSTSHYVSVNGGRTRADVFRDLDLPDGSLSASLGLSSGDSGKISTVGSLDYRYILASGSITLGLSRDVQTNNDDDELEVTRARFGWNYDLTALSGIGLNVDYASTNAIGEGTQDRERGRFRASYRHELTQDWDLSGGYEHTTSKEEGEGSANENSIFLTIGRQFQMRP